MILYLYFCSFNCKVVSFIHYLLVWKPDPDSAEAKAQILSPITAVKGIYEVGLKSTQAWVCPMPMLRKMSIPRLKVSSHPLSLYSPFSYWLFQFE